MSKVSFLGYVKDRLGGFEVDDGRSRSWRRRGRPSSTCSRSTTPTTSRSTRRRSARCVGSSAKGPITLHRPGAAADRHRQPQGGRATGSTSPTSSCRRPARAGSGATSTTRTTRSTSHAVAEAMREEYLGIVDAGFILQVDDPWLIDMLSDPRRAVEDARVARQAIHVEALNHALRGIPDGPDPAPHVLRPQPRPAPDRHPACKVALQFTLADQRRRLLVRGRRTRGTCTSGARSGKTSGCPTARS